MVTAGNTPFNDPPASGVSAGPALRSLGTGMGVLSIILGILVLAFPTATLLFVAIMFAIELIVLGGVRIAVATSVPGQPGYAKILGIVLGILTVIAGILCLFRPSASLLLIAVFLAAGWIADGIASLMHSFQGGRSAGGTVFLVLSGVVSIIGGLVVAILPGASLLLLARFAGIVLIVVGVVQVIAALGGHRSAPKPA